MEQKSDMEQKRKKYYLIPLIIGILMTIAGIVLVVLASTSSVPEMGVNNGWFEAKTAKEGKLFGGAALISIGLFVAIGLTIIVKTMGSAGSAVKRSIINFTEHNETLEKVISNNSPKTKTCAYCDAEIEINKFECPHCGAKQTKK